MLTLFVPLSALTMLDGYNLMEEGSTNAISVQTHRVKKGSRLREYK